MHAMRRAARTARRRVRGRRTTYTICGLPRRPAARRFRVWPPGAVCLALALCALWVVRNTPIVATDPTQGALVMRYTFEDFANASR
jgi:hypothetical protein